MAAYIGGLLCVLALVAGTVGFGWQQLKLLRRPPGGGQLTAEDRAYFRRQVLRRLVGCGLMLVLAVMLGFFLVAMPGLDQLVDRGAAARAAGEQLTPEESDYVWFCFLFVGAIMLVVMALLGVALVDLKEIRRYGMRHRKRIRDDREAMLRRQLPILRREREQRE
jgi:hypothetical protein